MAELKAIILIGDASENFVECIFMDLFHWAERILIDSNLYFLVNVLSESFCSILYMMRPILQNVRTRLAFNLRIFFQWI